MSEIIDITAWLIVAAFGGLLIVIAGEAIIQGCVAAFRRWRRSRHPR